MTATLNHFKTIDMIPEKIPKIWLIIILMMVSTFGLAQQTITVRSLPVIGAGPDLILPPGQDSIQSMVVTDDPGPGQTYSYDWTGPNGYSSTVIQPWLSDLGTYTIQATNIYGCSSSDQLLLRAANPTDTIWLVSNLPSMCQGDSIILDNYLTYPSEGILEGQGVVNRICYANSVGTFDINWIMGIDTVNTSVTIYGNPEVQVNRDTVFHCQGQSVWLSAVGIADSYTWSLLGDTNILSNEQYYSVIVNNPQQYLLTAGVNHSDKTCFIRDTTTTLPISANFTYVQDTGQGTYGPIFGSEVNFIPDYKGGSSYEWDFGNILGGATSTEVLPTYNYPYTGYYTVTLNIVTFCGSFNSSQVVRINHIVTTGIDDNIRDQEILLYPNPAVDYIYLEFGEARVSTIQVFDISGRMVSMENVDGFNYRMDVSSYRQGTYIVKLFDENGSSVTAKFIKQ